MDWTRYVYISLIEGCLDLENEKGKTIAESFAPSLPS